MAIEKRKSKSGAKYRAYWNNPFTGKREHGEWTSNQHEAKQLSDLMKYRLQHERGSFREAKRDSLTIADVFMEYLQGKELAYDTRRCTLYIARDFVVAFGDTKAEELSVSQVREFESQKRKEGLKQTTIYAKIATLRAALNWCVQQQLIEKNPIAGQRWNQGRYERIVPPTPTEINAILENALPHVVRAVILSFNLGLRVGKSELFKLRWENFDLEHGIAVFQTAHKRDEQWRKVPIRSDILHLLGQWRSEDSVHDIPWCIHWRGKPIKSISDAWLSAVRGAGITRKIRPYDLRHAFATYALEAGVDAGVVAKLMGHVDTTQIHRTYQHVLDSQKIAAVNQLPAIGATQKLGHELGHIETDLGHFSDNSQKFHQ